MRIVAGRFRGRPLRAPSGETTRPTADRLRGALFSMLTSRLGSFEGLAVADLFAGSGALGLEALSRGAARATFVERDRAALDALRANIDALGVGMATQILPLAVENLRAASAPVDLMLMDPPYRSGAGSIALARLASLGWLAPGAWIAIETARGEALAAPGFTVEAERDQGAGRITLLRAG